MLKAIHLNLVGTHAAAALAAVTDARYTIGTVALFNPGDLSQTQPPATLLASPAAFAAGRATFLAEAFADGLFTTKVDAFPAARFAVADFEAVLPAAHDRSMETPWTNAYGAERGVREYSAACRFVFETFAAAARYQWRKRHGVDVRVGGYACVQLTLLAITSALPQHMAYVPAHKAMFGVGGPYAWMIQSLNCLCHHFYVPDPGSTYDALMAQWVTGASPLQEALRGENQITHRMRDRRDFARRRGHETELPIFTPYLGVNENNSSTLASANAINATLAALEARPEGYEPIIWAFVDSSDRATAVAAVLNGRWSAALDAHASSVKPNED